MSRHVNASRASGMTEKIMRFKWVVLSSFLLAFACSGPKDEPKQDQPVPAAQRAHDEAAARVKQQAASAEQEQRELEAELARLKAEGERLDAEYEATLEAYKKADEAQKKALDDKLTKIRAGKATNGTGMENARRKAGQ